MSDLEIAEAFEQLASEVQPGPGRWDAIERRIRRRHNMRLATNALVSVVVVVAVVTVPPRIGALRDDRFGGPSQAPATSDHPSVFRNEQDGLQIRFPSNWRFDGFQDGVPGISLTPPGKSGEGGFSIELFTHVGTSYDDHTGFGETPFERIPSIDGASAVRWEEAVKQSIGNHRRVVYRIDWTGRRASWADRTCPEGRECDPRADTLQFLLTSENDEFWEQYREAAERVVKSLVQLEHVRFERWEGVVVYTRRGRIDAVVTYDDKTSVLVQFLDARADGGDVRRLYDGQLQTITRYRVIERASAGRDAEFTVTVEGASAETEVVSVGPGDSGDLEIRDVRLVVRQASPTG